MLFTLRARHRLAAPQRARRGAPCCRCGRTRRPTSTRSLPSWPALGGVAPSPPANVAAADIDLARRRVKGRLGQLRGEQDALRLLLAAERVVVGAYFVALTKLEDRRLIVLAAQIMANDAQHEALIGELLYPGTRPEGGPVRPRARRPMRRC